MERFLHVYFPLFSCESMLVMHRAESSTHNSLHGCLLTPKQASTAFVAGYIIMASGLFTMVSAAAFFVHGVASLVQEAHLAVIALNQLITYIYIGIGAAVGAVRLNKFHIQNNVPSCL